ncbi:MAG: SseB family protein [Salinibacterium sp.]|nr:SseB family protein [Salinibacterium sp.]
MTDSAGVPWAGRRFEQNASSDDDGAAPEALMEAIRRFHTGELGEADVVDAVRDSRLLIPLVAELGADGVTEHGHDKSQELSIVTVAGPDGRTVLPAFTSVDAMARWNSSARPVPATAARVALAAASEGTDLVVLDPTSDTEFVVRRPALWAIAQAQQWTPSHADPDVLAAFMAGAEPEPVVAAVLLAAGDPGCRLAGPELIVQLSLAPGLDQVALDTLLARVRDRWSHDELIAARVDSMRVVLVGA